MEYEAVELPKVKVPASLFSKELRFAGGTLKSGESLEVVPPTGQVLAAIAYDATGTELTLLQVTDGTSGGGSA